MTDTYARLATAHQSTGECKQNTRCRGAGWAGHARKQEKLDCFQTGANVQESAHMHRAQAATGTTHMHANLHTKKRRQTWKACSDRTSKHPCGQTSPPYDGRGPLHKSQPVALIARPLRAIGSSVLHQAGNLLNPVQPRTQQGNSPKPSRNTMPSSLGIGAWRPQA